MSWIGLRFKAIFKNKMSHKEVGLRIGPKSVTYYIRKILLDIFNYVEKLTKPWYSEFHKFR